MKKQKFHRIGNSKEPTPSQIGRMAGNLRNKRGEYSVVRISAWSHYLGSTYVEYQVITANTPVKEFKSWPEALAYYRKLMKGK